MRKVISFVDGKHKLSKIVDKLNSSYEQVVPIVEKLIVKGLFTLRK